MNNMTQRTLLILTLTLAFVAVVTPVSAQFPGVDQVVRGAMLVNDLNISAEEERAIGERVSERIRQRYGVVQDPSVHRYLTLVGAVLAQGTAQPKLTWQFIVLDTDGVNAFAAPGGFVHVTRGALALLRNEAELAGVLGHEIVHVTEKHTIAAIKKGRLSDFGIEAGAAQAPGGGLSQTVLDKLADRATEMVLAGFGRTDELDSDQKGVTLANAVGYAPSGLGDFLTRLAERNKDSAEKRGLFASHPEMKERLDRLSAQIKTQKLSGAAVLAERYQKFVSFESKPLTEIAVVEAGASGLTGGGAQGKASTSEKGGTGDKSEKTETGEQSAKTDSTAKADASAKGDQGAAEEAPKKKKGMFGLGRKVFGGGDEKKSAQVTGSGGARGVDPERDAKGGSNPALVAVTLTAPDVDQFKKDGGLK